MARQGITPGAICAPADVERLDHGVTVIDTGFQRPGFDAAYLVVEQGRAAFVDSGSYLAVPRMMAALKAQGLDAQAVDWVILTHVHLDHAGGAGLLMQQLPQARLAVHARGARHMIDPTQLMAGVRAVYGDEVAARDYGDLVPVAAERVVPATDGMTLSLAGRSLQLFDMPGHARHHLCVWDARSRGWFTGDTLGLAYREMRTPAGHYGLPSTTPVQFDPPALADSIQRMLSFDPACAYLTHYGVVHRVQEQAAMVLHQTDRMVQIALQHRGVAERGLALRATLAALYVKEAALAGVVLSDPAWHGLLAADIELNAQGLEVWLDAASG
jgi:glyoxylase-like metal-dependent hydrolase (beta-lactamase superfamily II)